MCIVLHMDVAYSLPELRIGVESRIRLFFTAEKRNPTFFYNPLKEFVMNGGKRIRPILCGMAFKAAGGKGITPALIDAAAAIEMIHDFSLIHDDIEDGSLLRRGVPAMHLQFGVPYAVNAGDGLLACAFELLSSSKNLEPSSLRASLIREISEAVAGMCEGQALDIQWATDGKALESVSSADYVRMAGLKTGCLFSACTAAGLMLSGTSRATDAKRADAFRDYGRALGIAFQIQDDVLNFSGSGKEYGKMIGDDVIEGKKTLLLIRAYELSSSKERETLRTIYSKKKRSFSDAARVASVFRKHHAEILSYSRDAAVKGLDSSRPAFVKACGNKEFLEKFMELERFVLVKRRA